MSKLSSDLLIPCGCMQDHDYAILENQNLSTKVITSKNDTTTHNVDVLTVEELFEPILKSLSLSNNELGSEDHYVNCVVYLLL